MRRGVSKYARIAALAGVGALAALTSRTADAQLLVTSADGSTTYRLGILSQVQFDAQDNTGNNTGTADNIFFRRLRLQGEFTFEKNLQVFFETDNPNYGKGNADGSKNQPSIIIQTLYMTYAFAPEFQIDAGMLLEMNSYNHLQSAASIMAVDLSPYTNTDSTPLTGNGGRDWGTEVRGYIADHLEYRAGIFQGLRGKNDTNPFRYSARLSYYVVGIETSRFYRGTSLGKIQTLEFGGSYDSEKSYKNYDVDFFYDQPMNGGDGLTLQGDWGWWDGHDFLTAIPKQTTRLGEIGYYIHDIKLQPFFQYAQEKYASGVALPSEKRYQVGVGYYFHGYNSNFKLAYGKIDRDGVASRNDIVAQYQVSLF